MGERGIQTTIMAAMTTAKRLLLWGEEQQRSDPGVMEQRGHPFAAATSRRVGGSLSLCHTTDHSRLRAASGMAGAVCEHNRKASEGPGGPRTCTANTTLMDGVR